MGGSHNQIQDWVRYFRRHSSRNDRHLELFLFFFFFNISYCSYCSNTCAPCSNRVKACYKALIHAVTFWSYHRRLVDAVGVWLDEVKMHSQVLLLQWTEANRSPERSAISSHPPTPSSLHKPLLRITALFVIYEQIALQSTLWIYADSSWDQFNSGWGGWKKKKSPGCRFPITW